MKRPRACQKCQAKRQYENEKAWRIKNKSRFDRAYAKGQKQQRRKTLREVAAAITSNLQVGARFNGKSFPLDEMKEALFQFLHYLGLRRVNKLWAV
ncbi:MAG: hypothetical protein ABIQ95_02725 [Bdellovibrionia bacterium]